MQDLSDFVIIGLIAAPFVVGMLGGGVALSGRRVVHQEARVRWFRKPRNRPAVYVMRSLSDPSLFKVGYTARRIETRKAEIERVRGPVSIVMRVRMPHAYAAEMLCHRRLSAKMGVKALGNEWYRCRSEDKILRCVRSSVYKTRRSAKMRFSWPHDNDISIWRNDHA